jgi:hypothetical protein
MHRIKIIWSYHDAVHKVEFIESFSNFNADISPYKSTVSLIGSTKAETQAGME